jgi:hypothetical protein
MSTRRSDGNIHSTVVNAGVMRHPLTTRTRYADCCAISSWRLVEHAQLSPDGSHRGVAGQLVLANAFLREVVAPYFT